MNVILITIKEASSRVYLPGPIEATAVSIVSSYNAPSEFIVVTSDIAKPQKFDSYMRQIVGHIPTPIDCFRPLLRTRFSEFFIGIEDTVGRPYHPESSFIIELCFK